MPRLLSTKRARLTLATAVALIVLLLGLSLSGHGLGFGSDEVAILRNGQLLTVRSDGSSARQIAAGHIAGFAWSPDHHSLVFRVARQAGSAPTIPSAPDAPGPDAPGPDAPGQLEAASVNGGFPLQVSPENPSFLLSDAWWDTAGNRVLYREASPSAPESPLYIVSQTDQPAGIARKIVTNAAGMPALSPDGQTVATVNAIGDVTVGAPDGSGSVIAHGGLLTLATGRPARLLWRPGRAQVMYDAIGPNGAVNLMLADIHGSTQRMVAISGLVDDAFSPDGNWLLARTSHDFALYRLGGAAEPTLRWADADPEALPWWSPDGKIILIHDVAGWQRVDIAAKAVTPLLQSGVPPVQVRATHTYWTPATDNPWSPDGGSIAFAASAKTQWLGHTLTPPSGATAGEYVADVSTASEGSPRLISSGGPARVSWGYADPATVFLVGSDS